MLGKKVGLMKKLARKANRSTFGHDQPQYHEHLLKDCEGGPPATTKTATPTGTFAVYVGEERQRFIVPTSSLSHPLFKILLEKTHNEFGFGQKSGLVLACSVAAFREVVSAVERCNGQFYFGELVEEFL